MTVTTDEEGSNLRSDLENLFKSETRALIAWNLIVHKELTVKQLSRLINKDSSTITRNLRSLESENLVLISKREIIRNISMNHWKLNPTIPLQKFGDLDAVIKKAIVRKDLEFIKITLLAVQRNLENILNFKNKEIGGFVQDLRSGKELISVGIMDKETGELFRKELTQFLYNFQEEHEDEVKLLPIDQIGPDSYFTFLLATQFPSLDKIS
ncbi:MAG: winged helix-turn-helix domain-containing protein [Candidatus Hodarchaeales archaeon]|jgi:predicted transcriptional regulator